MPCRYLGLELCLLFIIPITIVIMQVQALVVVAITVSIMILPMARVDGCNTRTIVLKPRKDGKGNLMLSKEKCRTCQDDDQADTGGGGEPPPQPPPPGVTTAATTPTTPTPPAVTTVTTDVPIPIGDCECGQGVEWESVVGEDGKSQLNRPWMVHFRYS